MSAMQSMLWIQHGPKRAMFDRGSPALAPAVAASASSRSPGWTSFHTCSYAQKSTASTKACIISRSTGSPLAAQLHMVSKSGTDKCCPCGDFRELYLKRHS